jgi:putative selenium metabolism hydrolase
VTTRDLPKSAMSATEHGDPVALAARLVRIPGGSGEEQQVGDAVCDAMAALGYRDVHRDELGSVIGIAGPPSGSPALLFDGHLDVVPPAGKWSVDPFGGQLSGGRLWGRGATDMKGGLAAALCGVAAAARTARLREPVAVSATVLEETVEGVALGRVLDRLGRPAVVICEPSGLHLKVAQRGRVELLVTARGQPAHAAFPSAGRNAVSLAARAITALEGLTAPTDPVLGAGILVATDVISQPWPSISLLPAAVTVRYDRRTLVGEAPQGIVGEIERCLTLVGADEFAVGIAAEPVTACTGLTLAPPRVLAAWKCDLGDALVQSAMRVLRRAGLPADGDAWGFCTNGSESAGVRSIPTIGLGPGSPDAAHIADESIAVTELTAAAELYRELTLEFCGEH